MSKFQSTISVIAALASIFGAASAGWKLAENNSPSQPEPAGIVQEDRIIQLQKELEDFKQKAVDSDTPAPEVPSDSNDTVVVTSPTPPEPQITSNPVPPAPPAPPAKGVFE